VAGQAVLQPEEAAQEWLLRPGKQRHVDRTLPATQNCAQGDDQQVMEVMQPGVPAAWVFQIRKARDKLIHGILPGVFDTPRVESISPEPGNSRLACQRNSKCDSPDLRSCT
jgi:hypothetical protein